MSGEYRSIYSTLPDDDAFITLSVLAKAVFYTLKMKLPAIGIGRMNPRVLATMVNCSTEELAAAEAELSPKWVRREGLYWWIVNGLRFQPLLNIRNPKHRAFVLNQAGALPNSSLRNELMATYPDWFPSIDTGSGQVSDGEGSGIDKGPEALGETGPNDQSNRSTEDGRHKQETGTTDSSSSRERLLVKVPDRRSWEAELNVALEGMHGPKATGEQIEVACRDYLAGGHADVPRPSLAHFRHFIRRIVAAGRSPPRGNDKRKPPTSPNPSASPQSSKYADRFK